MPEDPGSSVRVDSTNVRESWPRYANALIGAWLFISAFAWSHTDATRTNTWIVGLITLVVALWAIATPAVRFLSTAVAVWLFFTAISLPYVTEATLWNNAIAAIFIFLLSLVPSRRTAGTAPA